MFVFALIAFSAIDPSDLDLRGMPDSVRWLVLHLRATSGGVFAASLATIVICVGLLGQRDWARRAFIALMVVLVLLHIVGAIAPLFAIDETVKLLSYALGGASVPRGIVVSGLASNALMSLALAGVFVWIAIRLMSKEVRSAFRA